MARKKKASRRKKDKPIVYQSTREMGAAALTPLGSKGGKVELMRDADQAVAIIQTRSQAEGRAARVRVLADPLDWYLHRRLIDNTAWSGGQALQRDHHTAFGSGFNQTNLDGFHGCANHADNFRFTNKQALAMRRLHRALDQLTRRQRIVAIAVCLAGQYANSAAARLGVAERRGMQILRDALKKVARFYYLERTGRPRRRQKSENGSSLREAGPRRVGLAGL
jgi:hypothetical protein